MALINPPGVLNDISTDSVIQRITTAALAGNRQGVCGATDFAVTQSSTPGMSVAVAAGLALVKGSTISYQGTYSVANDAPVDDVAISPGDPSNPRNDIVGLLIEDADYAGANRQATIHVVEGTPAGSPSDPALPDSFLPLARVTVAANESTAILDADIDDLRTFAGDWALARGRVASATSTTTQTGVTSVTDITGMSVNAPLIAGRRYKITAEATFQQLSATGTIDFQLTALDNSIYRQRRLSLNATEQAPITLTYEHVATTTGNTGFKLRAGTTAGNITIRPTGVTEMGHVLIVEDIGPA